MLSFFFEGTHSVPQTSKLRLNLDMCEPCNTEPEGAPENQISDDPLLRLAGSGKYLWADEPADEYVENLRADKK